MVQGGQEFNLGFLAPEFVRIGGLRGKELERHVAAQVQSLAPV